MEENKKVLLYQFDTQARNVKILEINNHEYILQQIGTPEILRFDDILRQFSAFRRKFLDYEKIIDELIDKINGRGGVFKKSLDVLRENKDNTDNFFIRYYSELLYNFFNEKREEIKRAGVIKNSAAVKRASEEINILFGEIRDILRDDWNNKFKSENEPEIIRVTNNNIIIRGNNINEIYTYANDSLLNFFYDYTYTVHSLKLNLCKCKYCKKLFLGFKSTVCCNDDECKVLYKKEKDRQKRKERDNAPENKQKIRLSNYLSTQKNRLSISVQGDIEILDEFDQKRKELTALLKDKHEEYIADHRKPDMELKKFVDDLERQTREFCDYLYDKWKQKNQ